MEDGFELWEVRADLKKDTAFAHDQLLYSRAAINLEVVRNRIYSGLAKYYREFAHHTVALHQSAKSGCDRDPSRQFELRATPGLGGYDARQFTGEKLLLTNLEDSQFWGHMSWGPELAIGTVVFLDTGNVWKKDEDVNLTELNWGAGIGFQIGLSRAPHQPISRIDFTWPIGQTGFAVTVGTEQQF